MQRLLPGRYAWVINEALGLLPEGMLQRMPGVDFLCGLDPQSVGLLSDESWDGGRHPYVANATSCHVCLYPSGTLDRSLTIRLAPTQVWEGGDLSNLWPDSVIHELGHALQWRAGLLDWEAEPVSDYAVHSNREAFAEALMGWIYPAEIERDIDPATLDLFERLSQPPF